MEKDSIRAAAEKVAKDILSWECEDKTEAASIIEQAIRDAVDEEGSKCRCCLKEPALLCEDCVILRVREIDSDRVRKGE